MTDNFLNSPLIRIFFIIVSLLFFPVSVPAQNLEEGQAAYQAQDYQKALQILKPLAEQGNSQAQAMLGLMYDNGHGVDKDPAVAFKWYLKAAGQGIPVVQHDVGVKYFQGTGVAQNYQEAAKWWEQAANAGLTDSQFNLGLMYYRGLGMNIDYPKASGLFRQAADAGHGQAQYSLAVMYAFGQGMDKDYTEALTWFRKSAAQGVPQAEFNLGMFYENGYGLDKDLDIARQWYKRAADQGLEEAGKRLAELDQPAPAQAREAAVTHPEPAALSAAAIKTPAGEKPAPGNPAASGIKREDWVWQQRPDNYTLQLASMLSEGEVLQFIRTNKVEAGSAYMKVVINGTTRYNIIYGVYNTYDQARRAIKTLPANMQQDKPWVRNFGLLQKMLK